jgi:hypothetical protein
MGWLYRDEPIDNPLAYLMARYDYDCDTHTLKTLDGARVGNTVYLAVRSTDKKTGGTFVFAAVILISNTKKSGFGYKDMTESMGPYECACPDRIMRLLSPITDIPNPSYTAEWRARVEARKNAKRQQRERRQSLRVGSIVTLPTAASFRGGYTANRFRVAYFWGRTPVFEAGDPPTFRCRLTAAMLAAATIAAPADLDDQGGV